MTVEQLMQPRYEVIADYPDSPFYKNEVLQLTYRENNGKIFGWEDGKRTPGIWDNEYFLKYPHLFRRLEWWERRSVEDMPEYVVFVKDYMDFKRGEVYKYSNWHKGLDKGEIGFIKDAKSTAKYGNHHAMPALFNQFMPATEQEYTDYITSKK